MLVSCLQSEYPSTQSLLPHPRSVDLSSLPKTFKRCWHSEKIRPRALCGEDSGSMFVFSIVFWYLKSTKQVKIKSTSSHVSFEPANPESVHSIKLPHAVFSACSARTVSAPSSHGRQCSKTWGMAGCPWHYIHHYWFHLRQVDKMMSNARPIFWELSSVGTLVVVISSSSSSSSSTSSGQ